MSKKTIALVGDSQTDTQYGNGVEAWNTWGPTLSHILNLEGFSYRSRVFGVGGQTTTQGLARFGMVLRYDTPDAFGLAMAINDPPNSVTDATSVNNIRTMILAAKHGVRGDVNAQVVAVAGQANLPVQAEQGTRYVVQADTSTTGGAAALLPMHAATITGSVAAGAPTVWEVRDRRGGEAGWGRVAVSATTPTKVKKIFVVSPPYRNWTTGGDTPSTPATVVAQVRTNQQAAVTAENVNIGGVPTVIYVDLYNFLRSRIVAGTDPDFSTVTYDQTKSWHIAVNDQHLNAYGHLLCAAAVRAALPSAWVS